MNSIRVGYLFWLVIVFHCLVSFTFILSIPTNNNNHNNNNHNNNNNNNGNNNGNNHHINPTDYFLGAQHRPKLEIIYPENGQILDDTTLKILIQLHGYELPSSFHDSKVCIALSTVLNIVEQCFDQSPELMFYVNGLLPGQQYALRIAYYERGKVIAVSMRNFKVGGIKGILSSSSAALVPSDNNPEDDDGDVVDNAQKDEESNNDNGDDSSNSNNLVSISTAVQVALQYQTHSMMMEAEQIYQSILSENPSHPQTLHLLGVIYYQRGEIASAIQLIQQAVAFNNLTVLKAEQEGFYNTLGECYRVLGQLEDARKQFQLALEINPNFLTAIYNLGLTLQQENHWMQAIEYYRKVSEELQQEAKASMYSSAAYQLMKEEARIRECDLLTALGYQFDAVECWKVATQQFPDNQHVYNELGNLIGQNGQYEDALELYKIAISKGNFVAKLNAGHMLELLGYYLESWAAYDESIYTAHLLGLPTFHIEVRRATVLPMILPAAMSTIMDVRRQLQSELDKLWQADSSLVSIDNAPPLYFGYSHGYYLAFHGLDNAALKSKLYRVYARMCPALLQGYFMDKTSDQLGTIDTSLTTGVGDDEESHNEPNLAKADSQSAVDKPVIEGISDAANPLADINEINSNGHQVVNASSNDDDDDDAGRVARVLKRMERQSEIPFNGILPIDLTAGSALDLSSGALQLRTAVGSIDGNVTHHTPVDLSSVVSPKPPTESSAGPPIDADKRNTASSKFAAGSYLSRTPAIRRNPRENVWKSIIPHQQDKISGQSLLRVGFVSRYMQEGQPAGLLVHGLIPLLTAAGYEVIVFHIDSASNRSHSSWDIVKESIANTAHVIGYLPLNIGDCASVIRAADLDVLIFPEVGMDPITYFLSYSRLAPVQAAWLGHPDTTGVRSIDYFLGSVIESPEAKSRYTEKLVRMHNLGTVLMDTYSTYTASQHSSPRTSLLDRARLIEQIGLPRSAHLYVIAQPLHRLHADFDPVIMKILLQDRLGYVVFVDASSRLRSSWKNLLLLRLSSGYSESIRSRIIFYHPENIDDTLKTIAAGHVVLDPFPVSGLTANLQALAIGVPVVSMPSDRLGGRFALALYCSLEFGMDESTALSNCGNNSNAATIGAVGSGPASSTAISGLHRATSVASTSSALDQEHVPPMIVSSTMEFVSTALAVTHRPKLREILVKEINERREKLFDNEQAREETLNDWKNFINTAVRDAPVKRTAK